MTKKDTMKRMKSILSELFTTAPACLKVMGILGVVMTALFVTWLESSQSCYIPCTLAPKSLFAPISLSPLEYTLLAMINQGDDLGRLAQKMLNLVRQKTLKSLQAQEITPLESAYLPYLRVARLFNKKYTAFTKKDIKRPFIIVIKGAQATGKAQLTQALTVNLEGQRYKVGAMPQFFDKETSRRWSSYQQMIDKNQKKDILIYQAEEYLPRQSADYYLVDLFIELTCTENARLHRLYQQADDKNYVQEIAAYKLTAKNYADRPPDIVIDTTLVDLESPLVADLVDRGMPFVDQNLRAQIRTMRGLLMIHRKDLGKNMSDHIREDFWHLILTRSRILRSNDHVLHLGSGNSYLPLIDAGLGAQQVIVTDIDPKKMDDTRSFVNDHPIFKQRITFLDESVDVHDLQNVKVLKGKIFQQVVIWNLFTDPDYNKDPHYALRYIIKLFMTNGSRLWFTNLYNLFTYGHFQPEMTVLDPLLKTTSNELGYHAEELFPQKKFLEAFDFASAAAYELVSSDSLNRERIRPRKEIPDILSSFFQDILWFLAEHTLTPDSPYVDEILTGFIQELQSFQTISGYVPQAPVPFARAVEKTKRSHTTVTDQVRPDFSILIAA